MNTHPSLMYGRLTISEVFGPIMTPKDIPARIALLREHDNKTMRSFCQLVSSEADPFEDLKATGYRPEYRSRLETLQSTESFLEVVRSLEYVADRSHNMRGRMDRLNDLLDWLNNVEQQLVLDIFDRKVGYRYRVLINSVFPKTEPA